MATGLSCIAPNKWVLKTDDQQTALVTQKKNTCSPPCGEEPACKHRYACSRCLSPACMHVRVVHGLYFPEEITPERRGKCNSSNFTCFA